jgi:serine protease AprX
METPSGRAISAGERKRDQMREDRGSSGGLRWSALWGKPSKGETRSSALWGKGGRGLLATLTLAAALALPAGALAGGSDQGYYGRQLSAFVPGDLEQAARANPKRIFSVIVQSRGSTGSAVAKVDQAADATVTKRDALKRRFSTMGTVSAKITGAALLKLARDKVILAITPDAPVVLSGYTSTEAWPYAASVPRFWGSSAPAPTIAIVDSGIDANRSDFGGRVVADVKMTQLGNNSPGDGRGHGTFVAGIAAGGAPGKAGASPQSKIVSIDVMDDKGMAMTSDVIAAADWILRNKDTYGIRVANFSLHSSTPASILWDPLDAAVERLWFGGVVVVAAAGNYGIPGGQSGVPYAPGNDPFVITVGAVDLDGSPLWTRDDQAAPWSAYGYTLDGFAKPEISAPGRYMVGPIPIGATLGLEKPQNLRGAQYMQLSGTSFAAPIVAGAAAQILAAHPSWTPDQVKGALMVTAKHLPEALPLSVGVGEVNGWAAANAWQPPNANAALNQFVVSASNGSGKAFDAASWASSAQASASWASASWSDASWASASWASASWASASWASASWASASWSDASWASASWASSSYEDNAEGEPTVSPDLTLAPADDVYASELEAGFDLNGDGLVGAPPDPLTLP